MGALNTGGSWRWKIWVVPVLLGLSSASCDANCQRAFGEAMAELFLVIIVIMVLAACVGLLAFTSLVAGIVFSILNLRSPTKFTRTMGITLGTVNTLVGLLGLVSLIASPPMDAGAIGATQNVERPEPQVDQSGNWIERPPPVIEHQEPERREPQIAWRDLILGTLISFVWFLVGVLGIGLGVRSKPLIV